MRNGKQAGFAYLGVLLMVAMTGIMLYRLPQNLETTTVRENEATLLFNGMQIARAIRSYHQSGPVRGCYPTQWEALLEDRRAFRLERHLRQRYRDPMHPSGEWGIERDLHGRITGVHSLSTARPYRQKGFPAGYDSFAEKQSYRDWVFTATVDAQSTASPAICNQ